MSTNNIEPEERIAHRWRQRLGVQFPCDIESVVKQFADIEETNFPLLADAILVSNPRKRKRPVILLNERLVPIRKTFTLAHELGHLLIPWHAGTFVCSPTASLHDRALGELLHKEIEREANRFAAEFLLPKESIQALFHSGKTPGAILKLANAANISNLAASFKLLRVLPGGFLMAELTPDTRVNVSGKTRNTFLQEPILGEPLDMKSYLAMGAIVEKSEGGINTVVWVDARNTKIKAPSTKGLGSATSILVEIIAELGCKNWGPTVNGIIGAGNSIMKQCGKGDLYTVLLKRFEGRDHLKEVIEHPLFPFFLAKRAEEIAAKFTA